MKDVLEIAQTALIRKAIAKLKAAVERWRRETNHS
jgi:hypothetical protein